MHRENLEIANIRMLLFFPPYFIIQIIEIALYTRSFHGCKKDFLFLKVNDNLYNAE